MVSKKALVVDDDIRNIFAMTSLLEHQRMTVVSAESGREALEVLEKTPDMDMVLMDIMMPEMDGYDTMKAIRRMEVQVPAHHRLDGQGHEGRPGKMHRDGRFGLHHQAHGHGPAAVVDAELAL